MKFLVLALCVCAASAASFGSNSYGYKPFKGFNTVANTVVVPAQVAAKTVAAVANPVFVPAAQAAAAVYTPAQQVVTKSVPYTKEAEAAVLRSESDIGPDGFNYSYETANGISANAVGTFKPVGESGVVAVQGSYRYIAPDGTPVEVTYIADENGFKPQSNLLPVGPAIPEAIARSLAYIAAHPSNENKY